MIIINLFGKLFNLVIQMKEFQSIQIFLLYPLAKKNINATKIGIIQKVVGSSNGNIEIIVKTDLNLILNYQ